MQCFNFLSSEEAAKRRGSCVELLGEQTEGDSSSSSKPTEGDNAPKQTGLDEGKVAAAGMGRRGSAFGEKEEGSKEASQEGKDKLGNIPKLQRQRTRTRTISTSVYQDTEGRCGKDR